MCVGRNPGVADRQWLAWATRRFATDGHRVPALMRRIAQSDGFYAVTPPKDDGATIAEMPQPAGG